MSGNVACVRTHALLAKIIFLFFALYWHPCFKSLFSRTFFENEERNVMEINRNRKRKIKKELRLTPKENDILSKRIKKSGYETFQAFAYQMLFDGEIYFQDFSELNDLHYEVSKLGNNVNQLAKAANIYKQVSPNDVQELTDEIERLTDLLEEKLNHLTKKRRE